MTRQPPLDDGAARALVDAAREVRDRAYAPYSGYRVGAALRSEGGAIVPGANVENASYGLSVCAERSAVVRAVAEGHTRFEAVAVVTDSSPPAPPCGMCLQTLAEFGPDLEVLLANDAGELVRHRLTELLPVRFTPEDMD